MKNLPLSIFDTYEYYTLSLRIYDIASKITTDPFMVALCNEVKKGMDNMEKATGRNLKSDFTSVLLNLDKARDYPFLGLRNLSHSLMYHKDTDKATAAINLSAIFDRIGNSIHNLGYAEQTAKMKVLISALSTPEATEWLETVEGIGWFDDIVAGQAAFEKTYNTKNEKETDVDIPLLAEAKAIIKLPLNGIVSYAENNAQILKSAVFKSVDDEIGAVITDMLAIAHSRITREKKEKENTAKAK